MLILISILILILNIILILILHLHVLRKLIVIKVGADAVLLKQLIPFNVLVLFPSVYTQ